MCAYILRSLCLRKGERKKKGGHGFVVFSASFPPPAGVIKENGSYYILAENIFLAQTIAAAEFVSGERHTYALYGPPITTCRPSSPARSG